MIDQVRLYSRERSRERKVNLSLGPASGRRVSERAVAGAPSVTTKKFGFCCYHAFSSLRFV